MGRTATAKKVHVVTYIRMSTDKQEASPERQRGDLKKHCEKHGYIIDHEYSDLGISGDNTKKRKQFLEMIHLASVGQITHILAYDSSRLGRFDSLEAGKYFTDVRDAGCVIETIADGVLDFDEFGSRVTHMIKQESDHAKIVTMSRDVVSGQTAVAMAGVGYPGCDAPIGYKRVVTRTKSTSRDRNKWTSELQIDEDKAPIVQRIFREYNKPDGSIRGVAAKLNDEGIPAPKGGIWRQMTLQVILRNRLYRGDYVWGKKQTGKYHSRGGKTGGVVKRKKSDKKKNSDPIVHEGIMPRIIDEQTWQTTQRLLEERKRDYTPPKTRKPLTGLIYCKDCGQKMRSDGDGYRCASAGSDQEKRCPSYRLPGNDMLMGIAEALNQELNTKAGKAGLRKALKKSLENKQSNDGDIQQLQKRLKDLDSEIETGAANLTRLSSKLAGRLIERLEDLEKQKESVESELAKLEGTKPAKGGVSSQVNKVIDSLQDCLRHLSKYSVNNPMVINEALKAAGITLVVKPVSAKSRKSDRRGHINVHVQRVHYGQTERSPLYGIPDSFQHPVLLPRLYGDVSSLRDHP